MNSRIGRLTLCIMLMGCACLPLYSSTWYVRKDGGTRYSSNVTSGQCDGKTDAPYSGAGTNQHCAFNDVRYLWADGTYATGSSFPAWGWVGSGGDTYIIRGSLADGVTYRVGYNGPNPNDYAGGLAGNPYAAPPVPHSGIAGQHTRILGGNYLSCGPASAKTQLHGGYGAVSVFDLRGASYVDIACFDITDFSSCGRASQTHNCSSTYPLDDYAMNGIFWSRSSTRDTITEVHIHGMAGAGMAGPTGDGVMMDHIDIIGNAGAGWNADPGDGTTGTGTLTVTHFNISWNGCAEEYPIANALPYRDCTDDNTGGYGDGFGTTTVASNPAWNVTFDEGIVSYNTQDGLDALHLTGVGSSMTVKHTLAFGNMGQQIKIGGQGGTASNNQIVTNCNAMRQAIPGTPAGYNSRLSDFCRAADTGVALAVGSGGKLVFTNNTTYSASSTGIELDCGTGTCNSTATIDFENNTFIGFMNNKEDGYPTGGTGDYSNPIYVGLTPSPFTNPGSVYANNNTYHAKSNWKCPAPGEKSAKCGDPHLVDETWHVYGYGNMAPAAGAKVEPEDVAPSSGASTGVKGNDTSSHLGIETAGIVSAGVLIGAVGFVILQKQGRNRS